MQSKFLFCAKTCSSATKELQLSQCWLCVASPTCSVQFSALRGWVMVLLLWGLRCMWAYLQESSQAFDPSPLPPNWMRKRGSWKRSDKTGEGVQFVWKCLDLLQPSSLQSLNWSPFSSVIWDTSCHPHFSAVWCSCICRSLSFIFRSTVLAAQWI